MVAEELRSLDKSIQLKAVSSREGEAFVSNNLSDWLITEEKIK